MRFAPNQVTRYGQPLSANFALYERQHYSSLTFYDILIQQAYDPLES